MENIRLPSILSLIWETQRAIETNQTFQIGIQKFIESEHHDQFAKNFRNWLDQSAHKSEFNSMQRALIDLLKLAYQGQSIYDQLKYLESDYIEICMDDIAAHSAKIPLMMQIPLIFMIFPAIALILLVPTLGMLQL